MKSLIKIVLAFLICLPSAFAQGMILNPYVFANSGPGTLVLDSIGTSSYAAYSVSRKLRTAYGGQCIRVRKADDNTERDISFVAGVMDIATLESFSAGQDAFIKIIYDQSGNGRDVSIATTANQPKIVSAGICLLGSNGRAAGTWDGVDDVLGATVTLNSPATYFLVVDNESTVNNDIIVSGTSGTRLAVRQGTSNHPKLNAGTLFTATGSYTLGSWAVWMSYFGADGNGTIRLNNGSSETGVVGTTGATGLNIGDGTLCASMKVSEWIVYSAQLNSTDETTIRNNINSFYALF